MSIKNKNCYWEIMPVISSSNNASTNLTPRSNPIMAQISDNEILIAGGYSSDHRVLSNGFILDCDRLKTRKVLQDERSFKFDCETNQIVRVRAGTKVTALVKDSNDVLHLVSYTKDEVKVRIIQTIGKYN